MRNKIEVQVQPELICWAIDRAGLEIDILKRKFSKVEEWVDGSVKPTFRQLEEFAKSVHVSIGYLFLQSPPEEKLPIPDYRTINDHILDRPSPNLLDTIYLCQQRQDWYKDYARTNSFDPVDFIGSVSVKDDPKEVGAIIRERLNISLKERQNISTWEAALRHLINHLDEAGILVMSSSIVGSNTHRKLNVHEFRGFTLADTYAPLIFINSEDSKSAQMFTLVHELAHLWIGESGISNLEINNSDNKKIERWCNNVAAETLMPLIETIENFNKNNLLTDEMNKLSRIFKVSTLVVLRRLHEADLISFYDLKTQYQEELKRFQELDNSSSGGGDFYRTLSTRSGKRFAKAVVTSTLEGQTLFQDGYRMLGIRKNQTFYETARKLGVMA